MNGWQEFVSNIVSSAMWPLVVLVLGITFRETLRSAFERATRFEGLGATIEFAETLRRIDIQADAVAIETQQKAEDRANESQQPPHPPGASHPVETPESSGQWQLPPATPTEIILRAWTQVEQLGIILLSLYATRYVPQYAATRPRRGSGILGTIEELMNVGVLTQRDCALLRDLKTTRDDVIHNNVPPSMGQALAYAEAAKTAQNYLALKQRELESDGLTEQSPAE